MATATFQPTQHRLFDTPMVALSIISTDDANEYFTRWNHRLGACNRPFSVIGYALELDSEPISVAVSASTITSTLADGRLSRQNTVELARLVSKPGFAWATRPMLRLWREVCAQRWPDWPVVAAVSYSQNSIHTGDVYRLDGWIKVKDDAGAKAPMQNHGREAYAASSQVYGLKTLWVWPFTDEVRQLFPRKKDGK